MDYHPKAARMDGSDGGPRLPIFTFIPSLAIYLAAFVAAACEYGKDYAIYKKMCDTYSTCWPALYVIWALAMTFSLFSLLASASFMVMHYRDYRGKAPATTSTLVFVTAMWLVVIVVGWAPLNISLDPGRNGLPLYWTLDGSLWSTSYNSDEAAPSTGMFHYAVAWYRASTARSSVPAGVTNHGNNALAAVIFCNIAFVCAVFTMLFTIYHLWHARRAHGAARLAEIVEK